MYKRQEAIQAYVAVGGGLGQQPLDEGDPGFGRPRTQRAQAWEAAAVWPQAGRAWEEAREPRLAAEAYRKAGRWADAGRNFLAAGDYASAGEAFLTGRDYQQAGECLLRAGKPFEAATCFLEVQSKDDASRALRQVPASSQIGGKATMLLVPLLYDQGKYTDALQRLQMPVSYTHLTLPTSDLV